ncbi:hypothetical protein D3C80_766800 [compost metagenome]
MFGAGQRQAENIDLLKGIGANQRGTHLAGDGHYRNRIQQRIGQAGDQIGGTGTRGGDTNTDFAGCAGITNGSHCGALFVAAQ